MSLNVPARCQDRWDNGVIVRDRNRGFVLKDRRAGPKRPAWNRIADDIRAEIIEMALDRPELSPRELAITFTDERSYFVSEASVYRLLRARGLITSPAFVVMKAAPSRRRFACLPGNG